MEVLGKVKGNLEATGNVRITGKVLFLGGPLYYCKGLRRRFQETLKLDDEHAVFPEYGRFAVAMGAALYAQESGGVYTAEQLREKIAGSANLRDAANLLPPLFATVADYEKFRARHAAATVAEGDLAAYQGDAWLGIDCGCFIPITAPTGATPWRSSGSSWKKSMNCAGTGWPSGAAPSPATARS